jgi:hypothetical protein
MKPNIWIDDDGRDFLVGMAVIITLIVAGVAVWWCAWAA